MGFPFCDSVSASALESPRFSFPPNGITFPPPNQARSAAISFLALPLTLPAANQSVPGGGVRPIIPDIQRHESDFGAYATIV